MQILFYDVATPLAYTDATLSQQGLGGTEATVIRIAHALKNFHEVYIAQHCRTHDLVSDGVHYVSLATADQLSPDAVILLRQYREADGVGKKFPHAAHYLWLHNMPARGLYAERDALIKHHYRIIAVSHFHRDAIKKRLRGKWYQRLFRLDRGKISTVIPVQVIYNPIDDHLKPDNTPWKPEQMIFMSSPQKGLPETLKLFEQVRVRFPEYRLLIANPGYSSMDIPLPEHAQFLGALPHHQVLQQVRESFCVFYPQHVRCETFGLVYAEANAVGTPVLAHDAGAAREVLSDESQVVNGRDSHALFAKLDQWREKRPTLKGQDKFRLNKVLESWLKLF